MPPSSKDLAAVMFGLAREPRHDNTAYLKAIAEARAAFAEAEAHLGGPVRLTTKVKAKEKKYSVKWTFERAD